MYVMGFYPIAPRSINLQVVERSKPAPSLSAFAILFIDLYMLYENNKMKAGSRGYVALLGLFLVAIAVEMGAANAGGGWEVVTCPPRSPCSHRRVRCPQECPFMHPWNPHAKCCHVNCFSPKCEATCQGRPNPCDHKGSGCKDPRFIGGDGVVFYFHGRKDEHFTLVSEPRFQINAHFIGLRPVGRTRDFTWIRALGLMLGSHSFTIEATKAEQWDDQVDHLQFSYDGQPLEVPEGHRSSWTSPDGELTVERMGRTNNVTLKLEGMVDALINAVPVTKEDDRIHKYRIPSDDCFAHLDVQFSFYGLSPEVEGVLGRTYQPEYVNPAKRGVAMPVIGGEDRYWTPSLLSPQCNACVFTPAGTGAASVIRQVAVN